MSLSKSPGSRGKGSPNSQSDAAHLTIGDMSRAFGLSLRTLRFYEDRGLLAPSREGATRYYSLRDKARLDMILEGKRLGFTLTEIRQMLIGSDRQPTAGKLELKPEQIVEQIAHLERQRNDIEDAILHLRNVQRTAATN